MLPHDIFLRLPTPTALLLLSSLSTLASAHVARQTPTTIPHQPLNVAAYPPLPAPTSPPLDRQALDELLRREDANTICGYINGVSSLPATCSAGSHCVVDTDHGVVGCCPNGPDTCTAGVYTACVDANSGPQTVLNPYVYTCTGSNVCYKNAFEGGYSQFGCGTASDLAATVKQSASGVDDGVTITSAAIAFTEKPSTLAVPTTLGTNTKSSLEVSSTSSESRTTLSTPAPSSAAASSTVSASSKSSSASAATSSTTSATSSSATSSSATSNPTAAPAAPGNSSGGVNHTGAIVGGSIAGVAVLIGVLAAAAYLMRRRTGNARQGPGPRPGDTQYISPMTGGGGAWAPLGQDPSGGGSKTVGGKTITHITGESQGHNTVWQYGDDGSHHRGGATAGAAAGGAVAAGGAGAAAYHGAYASPHDGSSDDDEVPLRYGSPEIDDFSRGFNDALSRIGEEDEEGIEDGVNAIGMSGPNGSTGDLADNGRPLWLQSRRQSRNLMWT